ncbi:hypothetical protein ACKWFO_001989 [Enterobacter hormaechei]
MKDFKGTKDEWFVDDDSWSDGDHAVITCEARDGMVPIALINGAGSESGYAEEFSSEQRANAQLIAAAPDLLEALQGLVTFYPEDVRSDVRRDWGFKPELTAAVNNARAAISKALGEE